MLDKLVKSLLTIFILMLLDFFKINEISVTVNVTINKNGIDITKDLKASAMKKVKRGLFAWRY